MNRAPCFFILLIFFTASLIGQNKTASKKADKRCHPYTQVNGYKGATIVMAKQLTGLKTLEAVNECKDGRSYTIMSFDLIAVINKKKMTYSGAHGDITPEMKKVFAKCKAGSTVLFTNIKVKSGDGKYETVPGVTLHVK